MGSYRTSLGFTVLSVGMLTLLRTTCNNQDTKRAKDLSSKLQGIVPEENVDRISWARLNLNKIGLPDSPLGTEADLRFATNPRGTGIEVYNSGKYLGTVDLDRAQNYLDSLNKK